MAHTSPLAILYQGHKSTFQEKDLTVLIHLRSLFCMGKKWAELALVACQIFLEIPKVVIFPKFSLTHKFA